MIVDELSKYFSVDGEEKKNLPDPIKAVEIDSIEFREGDKVRIVTSEGTVYDNQIIQALAKKTVQTSDEEYINHKFEFERIEQFTKLAVRKSKANEETDFTDEEE